MIKLRVFTWGDYPGGSNATRSLEEGGRRVRVRTGDGLREAGVTVKDM